MSPGNSNELALNSPASAVPPMHLKRHQQGVPFHFGGGTQVAKRGADYQRNPRVKRKVKRSTVRYPGTLRLYPKLHFVSSHR